MRVCRISRFIFRASLPAVVVLPDPCSPTIMIIVGGTAASVSACRLLPSIAVSSSCTIFTICWPGETDLQHLLPQRLLLHPLQELARDLVVHVRFQQHAPDLPQPIADHGLGEHPALAEATEYAVELLAELVEHVVPAAATHSRSAPPRYHRRARREMQSP